MDTEGAQTHIRNQYSLIEAADGKSKELHSKIQRQTLRIRELETQRETVQLAVWNLKNKRAEEHLHALRNPIPEDTERRQHILGHFRAHLKDLDYKYTRTIAKLDQEREKEQANDDTICALENDISAACKEMGKQDPEGLYKELSGGVTGYRVRDPRVDTQAAVQFRSGFTNSKARPSSLRTVRSEAQTVIAPAPLQESDALVNVAQLTTPERQFYVQHPPFFHPQFGFSDPNAMYANYGNIGCVDNGRMGVGGPNTGGNDVETQGNSLEKDFQPTGPGFDVYDAQGFPISPNGLAVKPLPGLVPGYNDSPNRAYRVPMMPFPWMMPVHGHGQGPGFDGSIGFGGNVIPGCGMQQPSPTRRGSPTGREEHGASLKISPTRRKGTSFKPVKDASDEHGY